MLVEYCRDNNFWYWFGFIYADGTVDSKGRLSITLSKKDSQHLLKFKSKYGGTVSYTTSKCQSGEYACVKLYLPKEKSKIFVDSGIKQNKTYIQEEILVKVPEEYKCDFIRGYFDGDGCISKKSNSSQFTFSLVSKNKIILEEIADFISNNLSFDRINISGDSGVFRLRIGGNKKLVKLRELLYYSSEIYLDRKIEIFKSIELHTFKGYCFHKKSNKWRITVKPFVGVVFKTEIEAKEFIRRNHEGIACKVASP